MSSHGGDDERRKPRPPRLPANDRVVIEGMEGTAWTVNWSAGGVCVLIEGDCLKSETVQVELPERYARGEANVVWTLEYPDGCVVGLEFLTFERDSGAPRDR